MGQMQADEVAGMLESTTMGEAEASGSRGSKQGKKKKKDRKAWIDQSDDED